MSKTATATKPAFAPEGGSPPPIIMRSIGSLLLAAEAPKGANLVVRDSSRGSPMTDAELEASIYAKGIIQPLIWKTHQGKDYVVAGNRRLRMLRKIFADALTSPVQTQNVDDFGGDWREVAIDTNLLLPPHLVERYELIVNLATDLKLSPADTQARFGMSPQQYGRVMALGKMSENIRKAWKDAVIDAKTAQAFTLEPDPKEQDKIFEALSKTGRVTDWEVRRRIVPAAQQEIGKLVAFVGVDTVRKAKLLKQEDLFADDKKSGINHIVTDPKALNKLVGDKLAAKCQELIEAGWKWAIPESKIEGSIWHYGTIEPKKTSPTPEEKARLAEIKKLLYEDDGSDELDDDALLEEEERIEQAIALRGYTPEQMKKGGCVLKIANDGKLTIEYGRIKPAEKQQVAASERVKKPSKPKKPGVVTLTNAGAERLSEQLEKAVSSSLSATPHVAVAALIAGFASDGHVVNVNVGGVGRMSSYGPNSGSSRNTNEKNFAQVFEGAVSATAESRVVMLTKVVVEAIAIQIRSAEARPPIEDKGLQALIAKMDPKVLNKAISAAFDAKSYFDGVSLQASVDAVRCSMGDDHAAKVAKMKKGEAAKFATANVPAKGWLPKELRTVHYTGPVEKVAPAAKKPVAKAPVKKTAKKAAKKKAK